jgi:hypothetical protein
MPWARLRYDGAGRCTEGPHGIWRQLSLDPNVGFVHFVFSTPSRRRSDTTALATQRAISS